MDEKSKGLIIQVKVHLKCGIAHLGPRNLAPDPVFSANPDPKFHLDNFGKNDALNFSVFFALRRGHSLFFLSL